MRPRLLDFASLALLLATSLPAWTAWPRFPVKTPGKSPPAGGFHVTYQWNEQRGPLTLIHEIHIYGNGHLRLVTKTGLGPAQEFNPPRDKALADKVRRAIAETTKAGSSRQAPCGTPMGGRLTVLDRRGKTRTFDLFEPSNWIRFGTLVRAMRDAVLGVSPPRFGKDCEALLPGLQPRSRLPGLWPTKRRRNETDILTEFAKADTEEARTKALASLAWMRHADPFFQFELVRRHPTHAATQSLLRYGLAILVRQVPNRGVAIQLLKRIGHRPGPDAAFHRALLDIAAEDYSGAGRELAAYYKALARPKLAAKAAARGRKVSRALGTIRSEKSPWRAVKQAHAALFSYLVDTMKLAGLWPLAEPPQPRLAMILTRRALHHATMAFFSRGPIIRGRLQMLARAFLVQVYPSLTRGSWVGLPARYRMDMLNLTGMLRRNPSIYRATGFAGPESIEHSVVRLARLRRFREVGRFIDRRAASNKSLRARLLTAAGRTYCAMERWQKAEQALIEAAKLGHRDAWSAHLQCLVERGDLDRAAAAVATTPDSLKGAGFWIAVSNLARVEKDWRKAVSAARKALSAGGGGQAHRVLGLALAGTGHLAQAAAQLRSAASDPDLRDQAWVDLGQMALAAGNRHQLSRAVEQIERKQGLLRGCGQALVAAATKNQALGVLLANRALFRAGTNPYALQCAADVLLAFGTAPKVTYEMLRRVLALRPWWSRSNSAMARLLFDGGRPERALGFVEAALITSPHRKGYRLLKAAILNSMRSGAKSSATLHRGEK